MAVWNPYIRINTNDLIIHNLTFMRDVRDLSLVGDGTTKPR